MLIEKSDFKTSPVEDPIIYPGKIPPYSFIFFGDHFHKLQIPRGRRLGNAHIIWSEGKPDEIKLWSENLNNRLLKMGETSIGYRYPIVAIGSNANPAQLSNKYKNEGISSVIPVIKGTLLGIDVVYSAHITSYGSIPATPVSCNGVETDIHVTFVDQQQLEMLDESEPNYNRVRVDGQKYPLKLETGEILSEYYLYVSQVGNLLVNNKLRRLKQIHAKKAKYEGLNEDRILDEIVAMLKTQFVTYDNISNILYFTKRLSEESSFRQEINTLLQEKFSSLDSSLQKNDLIDLKLYNQILPVWPDKGEEEFIVFPNYARRKGEYAISVHPVIAKNMQFKRFIRVEHDYYNKKFSLIAESFSKDMPLNKEIVFLDQTIRNGLGIEIGDRIKLKRITNDNIKIKDKLIDCFIPRKYLVMRVHSSDTLMVEKLNCAIEPIAMSILGIEPGDVVVLESSIPDNKKEGYKIVRIKLRAYPLSGDFKNRRASVQSGNTITNRFPDCSEAFGVYPDLPWIFIDADARKMLGDDIRLCSPIRVRASRWYQVIKEYRQLSLVIVLTILGAISIIEEKNILFSNNKFIPLNIIVILLGIVFVIVITFVAIKKRLSPRL